MEWIKLKDKLPKYKEHILLYKNGQVFFGWRDRTDHTGEVYIIINRKDFIDEGKMTHWAERPRGPLNK